MHDVMHYFLLFNCGKCCPFYAVMYIQAKQMLSVVIGIIRGSVLVQGVCESHM